MRKTLVALAALGGLALTGCDSSGEIELAQREYNGKVTIKFVQEVKRGNEDYYRLEIRDSTGVVLGYMKSYNRGRISLSPERVYDLKEKGVRLSGVD